MAASTIGPLLRPRRLLAALRWKRATSPRAEIRGIEQGCKLKERAHVQQPESRGGATNKRRPSESGDPSQMSFSRYH